MIIIKFLQNDSTLLHLSCSCENDRFIEFLIGIIDVNSKDKLGRTPLHIAASKNNIDSIKLLISAGANVNEQSVSGEIPLVKAVKLKKFNNAKLLLRFGSDVKLLYSVSLYKII